MLLDRKSLEIPSVQDGRNSYVFVLNCTLNHLHEKSSCLAPLNTLFLHLKPCMGSIPFKLNYYTITVGCVHALLHSSRCKSVGLVCILVLITHGKFGAGVRQIQSRYITQCNWYAR